MAPPSDSVQVYQPVPDARARTEAKRAQIDWYAVVGNDQKTIVHFQRHFGRVSDDKQLLFNFYYARHYFL